MRVRVIGFVPETFTTKDTRETKVSKKLQVEVLDEKPLPGQTGNRVKEIKANKFEANDFEVGAVYDLNVTNWRRQNGGFDTVLDGYSKVKA